jgi:hypothetical protein
MAQRLIKRLIAFNYTGLRPQEDFMEDYDDAAGQAHQEDLLRQYKAEEDAGLFSPVYVLQGERLTAEIFYFKSMEA